MDYKTSSSRQWPWSFDFSLSLSLSSSRSPSLSVSPSSSPLQMAWLVQVWPSPPLLERMSVAATAPQLCWLLLTPLSPTHPGPRHPHLPSLEESVWCDMPHSAAANIIPFGSLHRSLENRLELFARKASLTASNLYSFLGTVI